MEINRRKLAILTTLVEEYLRTGEPVPSKLIAGMLDLTVSSATVRNEMASLFELGLLEQPHTSAGRIPSQRGLRLYLDRLMIKENLSQEEKNAIDSLFNVNAFDLDSILSESCKRLSQITGCAVVATTPVCENAVIDNISIFKASPKNIVAVLVLKNGDVKSKHFRLDYDVASGAIEVFQSWVNGLLKNKPIEELTHEYLQRILFSSGENMFLFTPLLAAVYSLALEIKKRDIYVTGSTNLLSYTELESCVFDLLKLLDNKDEILSLLPNGYSDTAVVIGYETHRPQLRDTSLVVTSYKNPHGDTGHIALIGPVRMDYHRLIPYAEYFSQNMEKVLARLDTSENSTPPARDMSPQGELKGGHF